MNGNAIPVDRKEFESGNEVERYKIELNEINSMELENIIKGILNYEKRTDYFTNE